MALRSYRWSVVRGHPFLVAYLAALVAVWLASAATWKVAAGEPPDLHPVAQGLQYILVVIAATLAALRLRVEPRETRADALLGFYDLRWSLSDDIGGQTFWTAIWVGSAAMLVNVLVLVVADLLLESGGVGSYIAWIGSGIASGALLGMFSALIAFVIALVLRRRT